MGGWVRFASSRCEQGEDHEIGLARRVAHLVVERRVHVGTRDEVPNAGKGGCQLFGQRRRPQIGGGFLDADIDDLIRPVDRDGQDAVVLQQSNRPIGHLLNDRQVLGRTDERADPIFVDQAVFVQTELGP